MSYRENASIDKGRQNTQFETVEQLEKVRFEMLLPELQEMYLNGLMPKDAAEKHHFPILVIEGLFNRLQILERMDLPLPYTKQPVFFPDKNEEKQQYEPNFNTSAYLKVVGIVAVCVSSVYAAYIFVTEVLGTWIVAFSEGCLPVITFLGQISIPAALLYFGLKSYFSGGKVEEIKEENHGQGVQKQNNTQININVNQ